VKVQVHINESGLVVNEVFTGTNADDIVGAMKARVAKEVNFALRIVINGMSNLSFAQEVVKRYNENKRKNLPLPTNCAEFLSSAQAEGFAKILD